MKTNLKTLVIVLAASGLLASGVSLAEPAKTPTGTGMEELGQQELKGGEWAEFMAFKLEKLHTALKLNPAQETAWSEWSGTIKADRPEWKERGKESENWKNLTVPERMEKKLAFAKEHVGKLEERLAATKAFYAKLSPEQRQTFDKECTFGSHGFGGKHR